MKKTNYVMLLLCKNDIMFEPIMDFSFYGHIKEKGMI